MARAHVCEMPDPAEWLSGGGMAVGDEMAARAHRDAMRTAAAERALPLLFTAAEVPFSALARAGGHNRSEQHARVLQTLRLYETARHASVRSARNCSPGWRRPSAATGPTSSSASALRWRCRRRLCATVALSHVLFNRSVI